MRKILFMFLFICVTLTTFGFDYEYSTSKYNDFGNDYKIQSYNNTSFYEKFSKNVEILEEFKYLNIFSNLEKYNSRLQEIPNKSDFENYLLDKLGEEKIISSLKNNILSIHGISNKCEIFEGTFCKTYKKLFTNTNIIQKFNVDKKDDKELILDIFPLNDKYFDFNSYESFKKSKLLIFDPSLEYYNISLSVYGNSTNYTNYEKKYKLVKYNKGGENYLAMVPYYQFKLNLNKGKHSIMLKYDKYISLNNGIYSEIQRIK